MKIISAWTLAIWLCIYYLTLQMLLNKAGGRCISLSLFWNSERIMHLHEFKKKENLLLEAHFPPQGTTEHCTLHSAYRYLRLSISGEKNTSAIQYNIFYNLGSSSFFSKMTITVISGIWTECWMSCPTLLAYELCIIRLIYTITTWDNIGYCSIYSTVQKVIYLSSEGLSASKYRS